MINLNGELKNNYGKHRSGWRFAINALRPLHRQGGLRLVSFIEKKFIFGGDLGDANNCFKPVNYDWIGFVHVPVNVPVWFNGHFSPAYLFQLDSFKCALPHCCGLFSLSSPLSEWLKDHFNGPVSTVFHPTEFSDRIFDRHSFVGGSKIRVVQLGFWLRKLHAIHALELPPDRFEKFVVGISQPHQKKFFTLERSIFSIDFIDQDVRFLDFLSNQEYDELLSMSVVFVDFYDTSANNAIVECMSRGVPLVCPPMRAIVDYLGINYPLYYQNYDEAREIFNSKKRLLMGHDYLMMSGIREKITASNFLESVERSEVLNQLF